MTDFPVIFSGPMVRALLEGRKTMTRRLALNQSHKPSSWLRVRPSDRLWVRETWADAITEYVYRADNLDSPGKWRSPLHCPRVASRLTLVVTATKIERLQEISLWDAKAEGIAEYPHEMPWWPFDEEEHVTTNRSTVENFRKLWEHLHGPGSWDDNPKVVALTFTVHKGNIDGNAANRDRVD